MQGKIKRKMEKGYGFIRPEGGGEDLFFHFSELTNTRFEHLAENDLVEFEVGTGKQGKPVAIEIRLL